MKIERIISISDFLSVFAIAISVFAVWFSNQNQIKLERKLVAEQFIKDWSNTSLAMERLFCFRLVVQGIDKEAEFEKDTDSLLAESPEEREFISRFIEEIDQFSNDRVAELRREMLKGKNNLDAVVYRKMVEIAKSSSQEKLLEGERICGPMFIK